MDRVFDPFWILSLLFPLDVSSLQLQILINSSAHFLPHHQQQQQQQQYSDTDGNILLSKFDRFFFFTCIHPLARDGADGKICSWMSKNFKPSDSRFPLSSRPNEVSALVCVCDHVVSQPLLSTWHTYTFELLWETWHLPLREFRSWWFSKRENIKTAPAKMRSEKWRLLRFQEQIVSAKKSWPDTLRVNTFDPLSCSNNSSANTRRNFTLLCLQVVCCCWRAPTLHTQSCPSVFL